MVPMHKWADIIDEESGGGSGAKAKVFEVMTTTIA